MKAIQHPYATWKIQSERNSKTVLQRFFTWCKNQEESRMLWLGFIVGGHGCVFTPLTLLFIMLSGNNLMLWPLATAAMAMSLVTNLAAMPTKITIPVFFLSLVIDLVIISICLTGGFAFPVIA